MPISITDALALIYKNVPSIACEIVPIEESLGRIIQEDMIASFNLPRFDNSAMDGYAIMCENDTPTLLCQEVIYAGDMPHFTLTKNHAIKIMTGAPIPNKTQAVIPIELTTKKDNHITLSKTMKADANIRYAGEDVKKGSIYLKKGSKITPYSIALLASQGVTHIEVSRKLKVALFGTGDELKPHYQKIEAHQLYNSNTPMFLSRAKELGCEVTYIQNAKDTIENLEKTIQSALTADIIITSGGVSMGDKDFTKEAFQNLGMKLFFDKIDIKPGKPTTFGMIREKAIINLPGNPLASMVNYELFVRAVIRKMSGISDYYQQTITTTLKKELSLKSGKYSVKLGYFDGQTMDIFKRQSAGMVAPLAKANAMMITAPDITYISTQTAIKIIPISFEFTATTPMKLINSVS